MILRDLKLIYVAICLVLAVSILSPTFGRYISLPHGEPFSELWILGPNHLAEDIPFNVTSNQSSSIFLGITNHMGELQYYLVYAKIRNLTDPIPDVLNSTPTDLEPLAEYRVLLSENETWERPITFSIESVSFGENVSTISRLSIDGNSFIATKTIEFAQINNVYGYFCELFFELWRYNSQISSFEFHNRFVGIWLNLTQSL